MLCWHVVLGTALVEACQSLTQLGRGSGQRLGLTALDAIKVGQVAVADDRRQRADALVPEGCC